MPCAELPWCGCLWRQLCGVPRPSDKCPTHCVPHAMSDASVCMCPTCFAAFVARPVCRTAADVVLVNCAIAVRAPVLSPTRLDPNEVQEISLANSRTLPWP